MLKFGLAIDAPALPAADRGADSSLELSAAAGHVADDIVGENVQIPFTIRSSLDRQVRTIVRLRDDSGREETKDVILPPNAETAAARIGATQKKATVQASPLRMRVPKLGPFSGSPARTTQPGGLRQVPALSRSGHAKRHHPARRALPSSCRVTVGEE